MAGKNTITRSVAPRSIFPAADAVTSSTADYDQGDILIFDDSTNVIRKPASEAECETMLGIAQVSVVDGKQLSPYTGLPVDAAAAIASLPGPVFGVVAKMISKTADAWAPGDLVYADPATGSRGVTNTGTKEIGVYQGKTIASAAAGQEIEVHIGARFPADALKL